MQTLASTTRIESPLDDLENLWSLYDTVFDSLTASDWQRKHGKDWVIADVPYHLSYFDRDLVLSALGSGGTVPADRLAGIPRTVGELNAWNAREFAGRSATEKPEDSVARWRQIRTQIRDLLRSLGPEALEEPVFVPLMGCGWMPARAALGADIAHHWNHYTQLRLYLKRPGPIELPSVRHAGLGFYMSFLQHLARADRVSRPFTFSMQFTGPGGGAWTFVIQDGMCTVREALDGTADLTMSQSPETFVKTLAHMHNPMLAMLTRQVRVRGLRNMGTFSRLMPPETDDLALPINLERRERVAT